MTAKNDEIINMAREQGLPETEIEGVFRVNADDLYRVADAILAARKQDDALIRNFIAAIKLDRHDWEDWPEDSRKAFEAMLAWQRGPQASGFAAGADATQEDAERHFFDAGWKACANFCDREDVRFDGIVGHRGCPQFEEAFRAARRQGASHDR